MSACQLRVLFASLLVLGARPCAEGAAPAVPPGDSSGDPLPAGAARRLGTVRLRHHGTIGCLVVSPDGKLAASAGGDESASHPIRVWNLVRGKELRQLAGHTAAPRALAFSPDGKTLASNGGGPDDGTVRLWEVASGKHVRLLCDHNRDSGGGWGMYHGVAFSSDGRFLTSAGNDALIRVWDLKTGKQVCQCPHRWSTALDFSPDGSELASGSDGEVLLWDARTGKRLKRLATGTHDRVHTVKFGPSGLLSAAGEDDRVLCWDSRSGKELMALRGVLLGLSPDGERAALRTGGVVETWNLRERKRERKLTTEGRIGYRGAYAPFGGMLSGDGKRLVTCDFASVRDLDLGGDAVQVAGRGHAGPVVGIGFTADGSGVVTAGDRSLVWWDVRSGRELCRREAHPGRISTAAFSADAKVVVTGGSDWRVKSWDIAARRERWSTRLGAGDSWHASRRTTGRSPCS